MEIANQTKAKIEIVVMTTKEDSHNREICSNKIEEELQNQQIHAPFIQVEITLGENAFKMQTIQTVPTQTAT